MALNPPPTGVWVDSIRMESNNGFKPYQVTIEYHWYKDGVLYLRSQPFEQANEALDHAEWNDAMDDIELTVSNI